MFFHLIRTKHFRNSPIFFVIRKPIAMSRLSSIRMLATHVNQLKLERTRYLFSRYSTMLASPIDNPRKELSKISTVEDTASQIQFKGVGTASRLQFGENVPRKDKISFLVSTLLDLPDSKEAVYSTLDAWVAWEQNFPIGPLKNVLLRLEKEQQWHRVIQVIKWMLSKGQGTTRGTYGQLIQALENDNRVEEAHEIWKKKLGFDLHSVPWKLCNIMISVYYRNNMHDDLVKLFSGLEAFDRKPPSKSIVQKVANAYELLGSPEEKDRVLEKYKNLFVDSSNARSKKISQQS